MSLAAQPNLEPGKAYRTQELRRFSANPARLASRLVREGKLQRAARGLFYVPIQSRFGQAPPSDDEILRGFSLSPLHLQMSLTSSRVIVISHGS